MSPESEAVTDTNPARRKAIVVGAGIGGLTAAWRLQQAGFDVEVFEREDQVSGRVRSIRLGDSTIDTGATVFLNAYRETLALLEELGLDGELQAIRGQVVFPRDGRMHLIDIAAPLKGLFTRVIGWRSKFSLLRLLWRFVVVSKTLNFLSLGTARGHDRQTLSDYCRGRFPPEVYSYLLNPALKFLYIHNGESGSLIELLWWMKASGPGSPRSLRRGTGSLTDALASRLNVRTQSEVTAVARSGAGVAVTVRRGAELQVHQAAVCIVTVPGTIAAAICSDGLTTRQREFLRGRRYDPSIVVSFCTRRRPTLDALMFMISDEFDADLATVIFAHNIGPERSASGEGIINAYFMKEWSERHSGLADETILRAAQEKLRRWLPEVADLNGWNVQRWPYTAAVSEVGDCEQMQAFEDDVDPASPIQVIGDFQAQASMNVAVANANLAAQRLARHHAA